MCRLVVARSSSICVLAVPLLLAGAATPALAETVSGLGIGTRVGNIDTHVDHVTYSVPVKIDVPGIGPVYETRGTVVGVGFGGGGMVPRASGAHYDYELTWVGRWLERGGGPTLVVFHHGASPPVILMAQTDRAQGEQNAFRFAELLGDEGVGRPALVNRATYASMNRRGLLPDGRFGAKYLTSEVPPLTQAEVDAARAAIAPGDATYQHPDLYEGAPVPLSPSTDTATFRDVNLALQQVLADLAGRPFRDRLSVANSAGAVLAGSMAFGCLPIGPACRRTGGNHVVPYDTTSPRIFDAFIMNGFAYTNAVERADLHQPLSGRVVFLTGRGDDRYQHSIRMVHELWQKGVPVADAAWVYEVANLPHVPPDTLFSIAADGIYGEPAGPYVSASIRNLRELLAGESTPPPSRIAGRIIDGSLRFDVAGGVTDEMPVREDPAIDTSLVELGPSIALRRVDQGVDAGATRRWQELTAVLPHENRDIVGPSIACRIGAYQLRFFGVGLTPFSPADLADRYGSFTGYRECVGATATRLEAERLYDPRVESGHTTAARARAFFADGWRGSASGLSPGR
jgi:hypothetical protein